MSNKIMLTIVVVGAFLFQRVGILESNFSYIVAAVLVGIIAFWEG